MVEIPMGYGLLFQDPALSPPITLEQQPLVILDLGIIDIFSTKVMGIMTN
jgi:hypothetical protein